MMRLPAPQAPLDEAAFWEKLRSVPVEVVRRALTLYAIFADASTPAWARALVVAALVYLINPLDMLPDTLPGVGLVDDMAVLAFALERLSRFVTPAVRARAKRLTPSALGGGSRRART